MRLIRSRFEAWLKAKPAEAIVGQNKDCHACPIALFYEEASGGCEVVISESCTSFYAYMIDRGYSKRPLPAWADAFVFLVDDDDNGKITAARALIVLGSIQ